MEYEDITNLILAVALHMGYAGMEALRIVGGKFMNPYVTGTVIKELREKCNMKQAQIADKLGVSDKIQMIKLYPEGNAEARVKINGVKKVMFYCNRDGLFSVNVVKGIDDKQSCYDDTEESRELEEMAKRLLG